MGVDKKVEETLKVLTLKAIEQGMEKITGLFDKYSAKIGQEIDSINQKIMNLETRIDSLERSSPSLGLRNPVATQIPAKTMVSSELTPSASYSATLQTRQSAKRNLEPASFAPGEDTTMRKPQREVFREYRPARGGIVEEKHVKVSVFSRELDRRTEAVSDRPSEGRTVVISQVRENMPVNEPINRPIYTLQAVTPAARTVPENKVEIEEWLRKTESSFDEMPSETRREIMPHYSQLKLYLCKEKKQKDSACTKCLIQNTIDCPLFSIAPKRKKETYITY